MMLYPSLKMLGATLMRNTITMNPHKKAYDATSVMNIAKKES